MTEEPAAAMIRETHDVLRGAMDVGVADSVIPPAMARKLDDSLFVFSGFKTAQELKEASSMLRKADGSIKPFSEFYKQVRAVDDTYNVHYLEAEYNFAISSSQMAASWAEVEAGGDRYELQYRTAGDSHVRAEHRPLNGITLPPDDPFWQKYYPPNGWNCRCTVRQVRKGKFRSSDPEKAMELGDKATDTPKQKIFRFNPGIDRQLFPPHHPYYKLSKDAAEEVDSVVYEVSGQQERDADRIEEMMAELPDNLTPQEKRAICENNIELEKALGVAKGEAMDYERANRGKENPNFYKSDGYKVNCQTCTVTHWLRRLGFDVEAKPNVKNSAYNELDRLKLTWKQRFINIDGSDVDYDFTYKWQDRKGYKTMTASRLNEYLLEKLSEDGVYEIYCAWKSQGAHVFCAERRGGDLRFFDPQSGNDDVRDYIGRMKPSRVGVIRIDNKLVNPRISNLFIAVQ